MDSTDNTKKTWKREIRRRKSVQGDISLVILSNSSRRIDLVEKQSYLQFADYCFVFHCDKLSRCIRFFKKISSQEHAVMLLVGFDENEQKTIITQLTHYQQLKAVFIVLPFFDSEKIVQEQHTVNYTQQIDEKFKKPLKSFMNKEQLFDDVQQFIVQEEQNLKDCGLFTICNSPETAMKDLNKEMGSFVWTHTFRRLLIAMPHNSCEAKQQMMRECRKNYFYNPVERKKITEFERTYRSEDAVLWYTKSCFISTIVNKTLRSKNIYALYIFRYFIFDLSERLRVKRYSKMTPISVYRGTIIRRNEIEQLKVGSLVASNGFLSTSFKAEVGQMFADFNPETNSSTNRNRNTPEQYVLFKINIDLNTSPDVIVADISDESAFPEEKEFLFDLGTTFNIAEIQYDEENSIWHVQMTPYNKVAKLNHEYDAFMQERLRETSATILFGRMLAHVSEYAMAIKYFHRFLKVLPAEHEDRPGIHYQLARMYRFIGKHQQSIHHFRCARLLQRRHLPQNRFDYGMTLAGLGTVYMELNDSKRAIPLLEEASRCYNMAAQNYNAETAFHFNRLSYAYYLGNQHERALDLLHQTLKIYQKYMPVDHPGHAQAYHNLGLVHRAMNHIDQAFASYHEALRMRQRSLAPNHPYVARTHYQIALLYEEMKNYGSALEYGKKALVIQELKLPSNHAELKQTVDLVQRLSTQLNNTTDGTLPIVEER